MDDKQKTIAVVVLAVVVVGVGAFQFLGHGSGATSPKKPKGDKAHAADLAGGAKGSSKDAFVPPNPLVVSALPVHDPFQEGKITSSVPDASAPGPRTTKGFHIPGGGATIPPAFVGGTPQGGGLSGALGGGSALPGVLPKPDVFSMTLAAVLVGDKPAAVFQDEQGNQRLVPLGGKIDGDSVVTSISRGRVTVSYKGKTVTLTVGAVQTNGNP